MYIKKSGFCMYSYIWPSVFTADDTDNNVWKKNVNVQEDM